jgi:hypothetical protein
MGTSPNISPVASQPTNRKQQQLSTARHSPASWKGYVSHGNGSVLLLYSLSDTAVIGRRNPSLFTIHRLKHQIKARLGTNKLVMMDVRNSCSHDQVSVTTLPHEQGSVRLAATSLIIPTLHIGAQAFLLAANQLRSCSLFPVFLCLEVTSHFPQSLFTACSTTECVLKLICAVHCPTAFQVPG